MFSGIVPGRIRGGHGWFLVVPGVVLGSLRVVPWVVLGGRRGGPRTLGKKMNTINVFPRL